MCDPGAGGGIGCCNNEGRAAAAACRAAGTWEREQEILASTEWCVVANHGRNPIAARLMAKLQAAVGKAHVSSVSPYTGPIKTLPELPLSVRENLEMLNLCVNPMLGLQLLRGAAAAGTGGGGPGAVGGSAWAVGVLASAAKCLHPAWCGCDGQLVAVCEALGLRVHEGCVLVEMH